MQKIMENKGITLVALVVSIIIMLILAGVTLNIALGENGLFKMAKNSVKAYEDSSKKEESELDKLLEDMNHINPEDAGKEVEVPKAEKDKWDLAKVTPTADGKGNTIPVPKGFYYVGGSLETGFVISDKSGDDLNNSKGGNQFVWIPCSKKEYNDAVNDIIEKQWECDNEYKDNGDSKNGTQTNGTGDGLAWHDNYTPDDIAKIKETYKTMDVTENWENNQTEKAENSLDKYNGFYIARFEAGIPENAPFYTNGVGPYNGIPNDEGTLIEKDTRARGNSTESEKIKELKPVSKKGMQAWNFITQPNAKMVSENMYKENSNIGSYLVDNTAWNVICNKFIEILGPDEKSITNSSRLGNLLNNTYTDYTKIYGLWALHIYKNHEWTYATTYKESYVELEGKDNRPELATGICDEFKIYNIYDMAGNMWEMTTSHNIKKSNGLMYIIIRGNAYTHAAQTFPVNRTISVNDITVCTEGMGFRVVLYIK